MSTYETMDYRKSIWERLKPKKRSLLCGLLQGITIDEKVNRAEIEELRNWLHIHKTYKHQSPFKELIPVIIEVLSDNVLEQERD